MAINSPVLDPGQRAAMTFHRLSGKEEMQRIQNLLPLLKSLLGDVVTGEVVNSLVLKGIKQLADMSLEELKAEGLPEDKALAMYAALELGRQWHEEIKTITPTQILGPEDLYNLLAHTANYDREVLSVVMLNVKNEVIDVYQASIGTLAEAPATPRELLKEAIKLSASSVALSHNHPSGNPSPSIADIQFTKTICKAGELLGIPILDHVVVGKNGKWESVMDRLMSTGQQPVAQTNSNQTNNGQQSFPQRERIKVPLDGELIITKSETELAQRLLGK